MKVKNLIRHKNLLLLTFVHLTIVLFCQILSIFFSQFLMVSSIVNTKLPVDFSIYTKEEKTEIYREEVEKIGEKIKTNPEELIYEFYTIATKDSPWILFFERLIWAFAFLVPAYLFLHRFLNSPIPDLKKNITSREFLTGLYSGVIIFLFVNLIFYILEILGHKPEMNVANKALLNGIKGNFIGFLWGIYSIALVTGLIEETFFRGFLLQQFISIGASKYGLYFTSFLFGFLHHSMEASFSIALVLSLVGFGFGILFIFTGNLWVSIIAHSTYNSLVLLVAYFFGDLS